MASTRDDIERLYREHPLRMSTLLDRVRRDRGTLADLSESMLATDAASEVTDQNNVGGATAVLRLAHAAGVTRNSRVLDLGCGLGGPARLIAQRFGCHVTGIELTAGRVRDARALTRLVGLQDRVSIRRGDMTRAAVPTRAFDILWGQSAWIHVPDKEALIARWTKALRARGRLAVQDACLRRAPRTRQETALVRQLERDWHGTLVPFSDWVRYVEDAGLRIVTLQKSSRALSRHFVRLQRAAMQQTSRLPAREARSWQMAIDGSDSHLLAYFTLVAVRAVAHRG